MNNQITRFITLLLLFTVLLIVLCITALCIGAVPIETGKALHILTHFWQVDRVDSAAVILFDMRLPRVMTGVIVGASLATAGATFQGLLRNPLAEPFMLGVSSGAALGVTLGTLLSLPIIFGLYAVPVLASAGAIIAMALVYYLARAGGRFSIFSLIISGVIVNAIGSAVIMFLVSLMTKELHGVLFWLMGRLDTTTIGMNRVLGLVCMTVFTGVMYHARDLNVLVLGEESAFHLGVNVERVKRHLFFAASVLTGCAVAGGGIVGFVGLIVPHGARALVGPDHRFVFPLSAVMGAALLVAADIGARTLTSPSEIPVGVITALLGGPLFLILLRKRTAWM